MRPMLAIFTGLPTHLCHRPRFLLIDLGSGPTVCSTFVDFKNKVCQGVPRCTRPSHPILGNLFVGKSQASERMSPGSLTAICIANGSEPPPTVFGFPSQGWYLVLICAMFSSGGLWPMLST